MGLSQSFTISQHCSPLVGGLGLYFVGAFTVFVVRSNATRRNDLALQCAGLASQADTYQSTGIYFESERCHVNLYARSRLPQLQDEKNEIS